MLEFFGRFHPLVVHLPVGILALVFFFEWMVVRTKWENLGAAIPIILHIGTVAAGLACVTGYLHRLSGEYGNPIDAHQWLGMLLFFSCLAYSYSRQHLLHDKHRKWAAAAVLILLTATGHLGGSLTHGEDYLFTAAKPKTEQNRQEAMYYADVIAPLLTKRCVSCHGANKQKGGLRLDGRSWIEKGGRHGKVLKAGDPVGSELLQRVLLPPTHDEHMPPRAKPQLTPPEITLLENWIHSGARFDQRIGEVGIPEKLTAPKQTSRLLPADVIHPAAAHALTQLRQLGATVIPVSAESNYLSVALTNTTPTDSLISVLVSLRAHIVWLRADCRGWKPAQINTLSRFPRLTRWWLNGSGIGDDCLLAMEPGAALNYLNLTATTVTGPAVETFLRKRPTAEVYLFQTGVSRREISELRKKFLSAHLEGAGYLVPTLATDTTTVK